MKENKNKNLRCHCPIFPFCFFSSHPSSDGGRSLITAAGNSGAGLGGVGAGGGVLSSLFLVVLLVLPKANVEEIVEAGFLF